MSGLSVVDDMIMVDVACNDPDNGLFARRAEMISIGYDLLELEARRTPPTFVEIKGGFRLAGKQWHSPDSKYGVGNWCWNGYWMKTRHVAYFLSWLHGRKLFSVSSGESRLFNMWQSDKPFDDADREFIWRLVGKPSSHDHVFERT
jgi:hypothetical protein